MKAAVWPDGTWCLETDIEEYLRFMSDDYELIEEEEWLARFYQ